MADALPPHVPLSFPFGRLFKPDTVVSLYSCIGLYSQLEYGPLRVEVLVVRLPQRGGSLQLHPRVGFGGGCQTVSVE